MSVFYSKRIKEKAGEVKHETVVETPVVESVVEVAENTNKEQDTVVTEEVSAPRSRRNRR